MKAKKQILRRSSVLLLAMLLLAVSFFSACQKKDQTASSGSLGRISVKETDENTEITRLPSRGLEYTDKDAQGNCLVKGIGTCTDTDLIIPSYVAENGRVIGIDKYAFEGKTEEEKEKCAALKSITIPDGLETIGLRAFAGCTELQTIQIPVVIIYNILNPKTVIIWETKKIHTLFWHG